MYDVIIVGAGPAGLSAALVLARCRRRVLVVDSGEGRNKRARELHGYLTRDGIAPSEFVALGRAEAVKYGTLLVRGVATYARSSFEGEFAIRYRRFEEGAATGGDLLTHDEVEVRGRKLLFATGMRDTLPPIDGLSRFYGSSVHHCPYCDGWEHRDQRLVAYGKGDAAIGLALSLRTWSARVTACTDGDPASSESQRRAAAMGISVREERVSSLEGKGDVLGRVTLQNGTSIECDAMFFNTGQSQRSELPRLLGCEFKSDGGVRTDDRQCTSVPGLYLAGDANKEVQFVIVAASEGATAAVAINRELQEEDREGGSLEGESRH